MVKMGRRDIISHLLLQHPKLGAGFSWFWCYESKDHLNYVYTVLGDGPLSPENMKEWTKNDDWALSLMAMELTLTDG